MALGVEIVGISFDPYAENEAWAIEEGFQYELWSDDDRDLGLHYGAASGPTDTAASRISFLLDADGSVLLEYRSVSTGTHPAQVLEDCEALFGD